MSSDVEKPEVTDYAAAMAVMYSMVKQDYMMQVLKFPCSSLVCFKFFWEIIDKISNFFI